MPHGPVSLRRTLSERPLRGLVTVRLVPSAQMRGVLQGRRRFLGAQRVGGKCVANRLQDDLLRLAIRVRRDVRRRVGDGLEAFVFLTEIGARSVGRFQCDFEFAFVHGFIPSFDDSLAALAPASPRHCIR